ncbi:MAG: UDP-3-O-(3-hydroxymyristoyl)glucosamine N-acyltransferase [Nitrospiraceae bacterium]|nr:UDP-3-O-(3-hydroxymyristoyl)glucosamine N-acyltransferase [Nitrospiraceae bacterium]
MKLREIADLVAGEITVSACDEQIDITGAAGIADAMQGEIAYVSGAKFVEKALKSEASAFIVAEVFPAIQKPQIRVKNPQIAFALLLRHFYVKPHAFLGVSDKAYIAPGAQIGADTTVYPLAFIDESAKVGARTVVYPGAYVGKGSIIGDDCVIHPNVSIYHETSIGNRVIIHAGSVIGADGFGYVWSEGQHNKIPQVGGVVIEDDVEIGANVTIDRATTGSTVIGRGSKIDNMVQVAHNVKVGAHSIIVAQAGIAGSCKLGDGVIIGGQVGIADHVNVEAGTMIGSQSGIMSDLKRGVYFGSPAMGHREWLKSSAIFQKLPEMKKRIQELEARLDALESSRDQNT